MNGNEIMTFAIVLIIICGRTWGIFDGCFLIFRAYVETVVGWPVFNSWGIYGLVFTFLWYLCSAII